MTEYQLCSSPSGAISAAIKKPQQYALLRLYKTFVEINFLFVLDKSSCYCGIQRCSGTNPES